MQTVTVTLTGSKVKRDKLIYLWNEMKLASEWLIGMEAFGSCEAEVRWSGELDSVDVPAGTPVAYSRMHHIDPDRIFFWICHCREHESLLYGSGWRESLGCCPTPVFHPPQATHLPHPRRSCRAPASSLTRTRTAPLLPALEPSRNPSPPPSAVTCCTCCTERPAPLFSSSSPVPENPLLMPSHA